MQLSLFDNRIDSYDYDAFGNLLTTTGSTPNLYLYAGQQFDFALGLYYNRARYLDVRNGRFWGMDPYEGNTQDPLSLHRYAYTGNNPVNQSDPSGNFFAAEVSVASSIATTLNGIQASIGQSIINGLTCAREGTCKDATTGALFSLAFDALAGTVILGSIAVASKVAGKIGKNLPLRFTQITARSRFSEEEGARFAGETIGSLASKLRTGKVSPASVPVEYIETGSARLIVTTRSALALKRANVPEETWILMDVSDIPERVTEISRRLRDNGLGDEGTDVLRITTQPNLGKNVSSLD